jgi:glucose/arabinose dehydrogenase
MGFMGKEVRKMRGLSQRDNARAGTCPGRLGLLAALVLAAAVAQAAPPPVSLRLVAGGFEQPLGITHAGDDSGRLFVVEKTGRVRILRGGTIAPQPFLDVSGRISASGERGLLGLAFHPRYATNRRFFVFYTRPDGTLTISAFLASAADPDRADPSSEQVLVTIPHGATNHNGGQLAFGADGYLYIAVGDGGGVGDANNGAQNLGLMLGKILRIDVDAPTGYRIPPGNPFAGGAVPEIWAYGLRNPWRFSFDRATGDTWIGDVGQDRFEEVNYSPFENGGGQNYGWRQFEGTQCFNPPSGCAVANYTPPVVTYSRTQGSSITGGYVYRGLRSRSLQGYYLYGDFETNRVWAARREPLAFTNAEVLAPGQGLQGIASFGEDQAGEVYLASLPDGRIYALEAPATARLEPGVVSGLWWNPSESGWGVQFTHRGDAIFATLYHYGADGSPMWYVASNCARVASSAPLRCRGNVEQATGPRFFGVPFDSGAVRITVAGTMDVTFHDAERATLAYAIAGTTRTVELRRQVFRSRAIAQPEDMTDLYNNASEPGWGLTVSHQGQVMFLTWYVYDDAGRPTWYVASNCAVNPEGGTCTGQLHRVTGPPLAGDFDASRVQVTLVGSVGLAWLGPDFVNLSWTIGGVPGEKRLARQAF